MSMIRLGSEKSLQIMSDIEKMVDFDRDLPANVFRSKGYVFWFFERPLIDFVEGVTELVSASYKDFASDVFISSSGGGETCFLFDGKDIGASAELINSGFRNFFGGEVGYPMVMGDLGFNWLAYESAYEEFGVLALRGDSDCPSFAEALQRNLLSSDQFQVLESEHEFMVKVVKAFREYFI
ncbi:hypothetical protein [Pseudomonas sp. KCJK9016]|uniref:hypothetical protein n=1 Tax=Pseudomonas sp. KCJK9016 TaxID=3344556 RepID=UPI00390629C3